MVVKKKEDVMSVVNEEMNSTPTINIQNVENVAPAFCFNSFDEFFLDYAKKNKIGMAWKEPLMLHLKAIGKFELPNQWLEGCKHFGI